MSTVRMGIRSLTEGVRAMNLQSKLMEKQLDSLQEKFEASATRVEERLEAMITRMEVMLFSVQQPFSHQSQQSISQSKKTLDFNPKIEPPKTTTTAAAPLIDRPQKLVSASHFGFLKENGSSASSSLELDLDQFRLDDSVHSFNRGFTGSSVGAFQERVIEEGAFQEQEYPLVISVNPFIPYPDTTEIPSDPSLIPDPSHDLPASGMAESKSVGTFSPLQNQEDEGEVRVVIVEPVVRVIVEGDINRQEINKLSQLHFVKSAWAILSCAQSLKTRSQSRCSKGKGTYLQLKEFLNVSSLVACENATKKFLLLWFRWWEEYRGGMKIVKEIVGATVRNFLREFVVTSFSTLDLEWDFYGSMKLINYVRSQVAKKKCWSFGLAFECSEDLLEHLHAPATLDGLDLLWEDDAYLKPFMVDDALLHSFADNDEDDENYTQKISKEEVMRELMNVGSVASIHREMISDKVRTGAYRDAIVSNPSLLKQSTVVDVGCGTGIVSLFAAQAGASRVIAVEASAKMASVATQIAKDNGLLSEKSENGEEKWCSGVINVVQTMIEDFDNCIQIQPHSVDIIVSEWMGYCLLYESKLLQHTTTVYLHHAIAEYAEALASKMTGNLKVVYFVNSGTEANELATLMARLYTGNLSMIALRNSHHGGSAGTLGPTGLHTWKYPIPQGEVLHVMNPNPHRGAFGSDATCYAKEVEDHIAFGSSGQVAGFIAETFQGAGGAVELAPGYLKLVCQVSRYNASEVAEVVEPEEKKRHLTLVFIGHVDAGKSTIGGQILLLSGQVDERTIQKYEKEAKDKNRESWYMAYIMDTNEEERVKGITVEVGRAHFETETTRFTILDAPGHKSYVPNMISGASQADVGVLVISARKGEFETGYEKGGQTREHVLLAKTLGVSKLVIAVNKMDDTTVCWSKERYDEIESKMVPFLKSSGYNVKKDIQFLPISGLVVSNIKFEVDKNVCSWWNGSCLFKILDTTEVPPRDPNGLFRMPIIDKYQDMGTVVMGKIESGSISEGDSLLVMPNKANVEVLGIQCDENKTRRAEPGENVRVKLPGRREIFCARSRVQCIADRFWLVKEVFKGGFDAEWSFLSVSLSVSLGTSSFLRGVELSGTPSVQP